MTDAQTTFRPRIGALIPIRLSSERFPRKALAVAGGRPLVAQLIDQVRATRNVAHDLVIVCTTTDAADDDLVTAVEAAGGRTFRGDRDDLIDRLAAACDAFDLDIALQVDGDDPLADPDYMDAVVDAIINDGAADVAISSGLPLGLASKAITRRAFGVVRKAYRTRKNDTGFGYFFTKTGLCNVVQVVAAECDRNDAARLTMDYAEDLELFRAIIETIGRPGDAIRVGQILSLFREKPDLVDINAWRSQEYWQRTADLVSLEFADSDGHVRPVTT